MQGWGVTPFSERENALQLSHFKKEAKDQRFIVEMNQALSSIRVSDSVEIARPTVFIIGLPRSGTTLAYQLIGQCFDIGYVNNLIARFWLAPLHGIALSQTVLGSPHETNFHSEFGYSSGPHGPHEFGYFWNYWLRMNNIKDMIVFNRPKPHVDWNGLGQMVRQMQGQFKSGIVFKTIHAGSHIQAFARTFTMPIFIYIERALTDVALSVLEARRACYGRADAWWSTYPPDYHDLIKLKYNYQIPGQVLSLHRAYERALRLVDSDLVLRLDYGRLCREPSIILDELMERIHRIYGVKFEVRLTPPKKFEFRTRSQVLDEEQKAVLAVLAEWST